jgi:diacylglycerol kinase (ATP)
MSAAVFPATPHARTDDGLLDVCLLHDLSAWKCATLAFSVFSPRFTQRKDVVYRQGKNIRLEPASDEAAPLQVDGDPAGFVPSDFGVEPAALNLLVP